jgi:DNA invertase Pin-like site-specific DNA recombinase
MNVGYARVSTDDQHTENQIEQLVKAGCARDRIYKETASGGSWDRPQLHKALEQLREGDTLIVWKLDRLSRSLSDLLRILEKIDKAGAALTSSGRFRKSKMMPRGLMRSVTNISRSSRKSKRL